MVVLSGHYGFLHSIEISCHDLAKSDVKCFIDYLYQRYFLLATFVCIKINCLSVFYLT